MLRALYLLKKCWFNNNKKKNSTSNNVITNLNELNILVILYDLKGDEFPENPRESIN